MSRYKTSCRILLSALVSSMLFGACDDDVNSPQDGGLLDAIGQTDVAPQVDGSPATSVHDGGGDAVATDGGADTAAVAAAFVPKGLVVVHAQGYISTSISITDLTGSKRLDDCLHTGSTAAGLTTALSGDVYLPTTPLPSGEIALIDSSNEVITFVDPSNCLVKRQVRVGPSATKVYPHDFLWFASERAYVSRNMANPTPTPAGNDFDEGNDILIINPLSGVLLGRIDIEAETKPQGDATLRAKPSQMAFLNGKVFLALNNIANGLGANGGSGRLAIIDSVTNKVEETLEVPGVKNCGSVRVAGPDELVIACNGDYAADRQQIDFSGIVLYKPSTKVTKVFRAAPFGEPANNGQVAGRGSRFFAVTYGDGFSMPPKPSKLWTGTFDGEVASSPFAGLMDGDIGSILIDSASSKLYVADAFVGEGKSPQIRVFDISGAPPFTQSMPISVGATKKFPVRGLAWF